MASIVPYFIEKMANDSGDGFNQKTLDALHEQFKFHPAVLQCLRWFVNDGHLPQDNIRSFVYNDYASLALRTAVREPQNPETTYALRALLSAKDCAVRAVLDQ